MDTLPEKEKTAKKKPAKRLEWLRVSLYAGTALFFAGAFIWGVVLYRQGDVIPAANGSQATLAVQATLQIAQPQIPQAPPDEPEATKDTEESEPEPAQDNPRVPDTVTECTLRIPVLSLDLPVTAYCTDEALLKSVCKFSGPQPGQTGNYVIAGHDYLNGAQFAGLDRLRKGDEVILADKNKKEYTYEVYASELVTPEDTYALIVPPGNTEATLLTCAENNTKRLLVRCRIVGLS